MDLEREYEGTKLNVKNVALKKPSKSTPDNGLWKNFFWITIPKRNNVAEIQKEYLQVMEEIHQ